jgi:cytosine/adenosine deaminase-related metal-dependent hydrolase
MCPTTERDLGDGIGPTADFAKAGVSLALGSDSNAIIDMFGEARALELHERLRSETRGIHSARALLDMSTKNGHRSLGWCRPQDLAAGEIVVGGRADLVTVDLESVRTAGAGSEALVEAAMFGASAADVTSVLVDGRRIVEDGRHYSIDVAQELHESISEVMGQ